MKVAIASQRHSPLGLVAPCLGRTPALLLCDTATGCWTELPLPPPEPTLAGIDTARRIVAAHAQAVIAGQFGESALRLLRAAHLIVHLAPGLTVPAAVAGFLAGTLDDC